jgi:hypothetical protein
MTSKGYFSRIYSGTHSAINFSLAQKFHNLRMDNESIFLGKQCMQILEIFLYEVSRNTLVSRSEQVVY